ncbi:cytochrome b/b6 domain-containing protein [Rugamonas apoptosis]|uniref:Cytochrome b/b6 domain-containing protein n=1 Tax=Rugamonas apoptosis TaxID=2758570 RepID=A0A7W2F9A3_9BURK|nr:cytochrome b/b6 domain-containing protein [Rugamonas apoptosis]MBA5687471.1 cytochrome b/b6 domain-containing protein [Rugamonas apoptosis]
MAELNGSAAQAADGKVLVWDAPVRVFHWLMVLCFAGAYLTAEEDGLRLLHVTLGYSMVGLVVFRLLWGVIGTRHARFSDFVRGPGKVLDYLRSLAQRKPAHYVGHNPAGALAIVGMLGLTLAIGFTGWMLFQDLGGDALEETHELLANLMLALVALHVAAVVVSSRLHGENLAAAMVTGRKRGTAAEAIRSAWRPLAVVLLAAVLGFGALQWYYAPVGIPALSGKGEHVAGQVRNSGHDED